MGQKTLARDTHLSCLRNESTKQSACLSYVFKSTDFSFVLKGGRPVVAATAVYDSFREKKKEKKTEFKG